MPPNNSHTPSPFGFNVIGYVSGNLGMGITARQFIRLLLEKGYPIAALDLDPGLNQERRDTEFLEYVVKDAHALPYAVNLILINIVDLPEFFLKPPDGLFREDRLNVGLIWWELTVLPPQWIEALQLFDVLVTGSDFVQHVFQFNLSDVPVIPAMHPIYHPANVIANRKRFKLPANGVLFLSSFDPYSDLARKNPFAAIHAFRQAFVASDNAHLVIKLNNADSFKLANSSRTFEQLESLCRNDPQIHIITESLTYSDVLSLYASCDVFVSLHRAEGLGLGPLEAMSLGKPIVATAWSGNLTYMNHRNSCLVGYKLTSVSGEASVYTSKFLGRDARWAEPDINEAAAWMKKLVVDPELRKRLGEIAAAHAKRFHEEAMNGDFIGELYAIWSQRAFLPGGEITKFSSLKALREAIYRAELLKLPAHRRAMKNFNDFLGRHILWRFH